MGNARLRHALALAEKQELENRQLCSGLIPTVYVRAWATKFLDYSRGVLLKVPSELGDALAAESDPVRIGETLRRWVEQALLQLYQSDELRGGGIESEVAGA
jgi:hypothetical protein